MHGCGDFRHGYKRGLAVTATVAAVCRGLERGPAGLLAERGPAGLFLECAGAGLPLKSTGTWLPLEVVAGTGLSLRRIRVTSGSGILEIVGAGFALVKGKVEMDENGPRLFRRK